MEQYFVELCCSVVERFINHEVLSRCYRPLQKIGGCRHSILLGGGNKHSNGEKGRRVSCLVPMVSKNMLLYLSLYEHISNNN